MARKAASKKGKRTTPEMERDVILIVKGAGEQAEDDHLNIFLRGFWPAVKSLDKDATLLQVTKGFEDYSPSPHNADGKSHKHVTEIRARYKGRDRSLWLKESYWESETLPSGGLSNLSREWRMASFVFANMFRNVIFSRDTLALKKARERGQTDFVKWWRRPGTRIVDLIGYYISYFLLFMLVLAPFFVSSDVFSKVGWFGEALGNLLPTAIYGASGFTPLLFVTILGALWAVAPTIEHIVLIRRRYKDNQLMILPVLPSWVLLALVFLLVSQPFVYVKFVLILLAIQTSLLIARGLLWNRRTFANSDVDIAEYYSYQEDGKKKIGKVDELWVTRLLFTPLIYRYLIFMTLPIGFVGTLLVSLFKWTKFLGGIGESLDKALNVMLVGYMDDVVNYAMDSAQSSRVRSAVINDIIYFYNKPGVQRIHVVAHSQGTPITYESLFHFLDEQYQDKIYTYATIGSVLSYYHQARGVLDSVYYERFPVSALKKHRFPRNFKWMNFWNFSDPITEFYGLDEYTTFQNAPPLDEEFVRTRTSPVNIRTRTSLAENHGEYWNNLEKFTLPFAKRVLATKPADMRPPEWAPDVKRKKETKHTKQRDWKHYRHHVSVMVVWILILIVAVAVARLLIGAPLLLQIADYFIRLKVNIYILVYNFVPGCFTEKPSLSGYLLLDSISFLSCWQPSSEVVALWSQILDGALILIGAWLVYDWLAQLRRAVSIARRK